MFAEIKKTVKPVAAYITVKRNIIIIEFNTSQVFHELSLSNA